MVEYSWSKGLQIPRLLYLAMWSILAVGCAAETPEESTTQSAADQPSSGESQKALAIRIRIESNTLSDGPEIIEKILSGHGRVHCGDNGSGIFALAFDDGMLFLDPKSSPAASRAVNDCQTAALRLRLDSVMVSAFGRASSVSRDASDILDEQGLAAGQARLDGGDGTGPAILMVAGKSPL